MKPIIISLIFVSISMFITACDYSIWTKGSSQSGSSSSSSEKTKELNPVN